MLEVISVWHVDDIVEDVCEQQTRTREEETSRERNKDAATYSATKAKLNQGVHQQQCFNLIRLILSYLL